MTHEQACREAAAFYQSLAAENAAIARALMGIEGGEA